MFTKYFQDLIYFLKIDNRSKEAKVQPIISSTAGARERICSTFLLSTFAVREVARRAWVFMEQQRNLVEMSSFLNASDLISVPVSVVCTKSIPGP